MSKNTLKTIITSIICVFSIIVCQVPVQAQSLSEAEKLQKELEGSLKEAKELVDSLEGSVNDIEGNIASLDREIAAIENESKSIEEEQESVTRHMEETARQIEEIGAQLEQRKTDMELRIVYSYENGRVNMMNHLFSSKDFSDVMRAIEYCAEMTAFDHQVINDYENTLNDLNEAKLSYTQDEERIEQLARKNDEQVQALALVRGARETELAKLDGQLLVANAVEAAYEAEVQAQNEVLAQIRAALAAQEEARKKAEEEARKKAEEEARRIAEEERKKAEELAAQQAQKEEDEKTDESTVAPPRTEEEILEELLSEEKPAATVGKFTWPCPSSKRITSEYGPRPSPTAGASSDHKGIDIGAAAGSDIVAADDGEVILSTYSSSAGNYIIVSHGYDANGKAICTVYMHCSKLIAKEGDKVKRGQTIAEVGSTGISTGNHLHFGVTEDGAYVSPWNYVSL